MTLGQEFSGYKVQIKHALFNIAYAVGAVEELRKAVLRSELVLIADFSKLFATKITEISILKIFIKRFLI